MQMGLIWMSGNWIEMILEVDLDSLSIKSMQVLILITRLKQVDKSGFQIT